MVEGNKKMRRGEIIEVGVGWEGGEQDVFPARKREFSSPLNKSVNHN